MLAVANWHLKAINTLYGICRRMQLSAKYCGYNIKEL